MSLPKATEPQKNELPKEAPFGGGSEEKAAPPEDQDSLPGLPLEEWEDEPPLSGVIETLGHRRLPGRLVLGGVMVAVVLAAGVTYAMVRSEKPAAIPPIVAAVPSAAPTGSDRQKLTPDRVDGLPSADQTKLATPGNTEVAEVPVSSGVDNNPISRLIEPAGPGFGAAVKASDAPGSADRPATNDAPRSDDSADVALKKARAFVVGPPTPVLGSKPASDDNAGGLVPGASPTAPPAAPSRPAKGVAAADASSGIASAATEMDDILDNKGPPIPVNPDPLAGDSGSAAPGGAPEPRKLSASDAPGAVATDGASVAPAAPATVPIPPARPHRAVGQSAQGAPTEPPVASSGGVY